MKALSLWQPWASLVALGVKTIETRSWSTSYRGPLAIHATAAMPSYDKRYVPGVSLFHANEHSGGWWAMSLHDAAARLAKEAGWPGLHRHGPQAPAVGGDYYCPLGAVVATCTLVDVVPMVELGEETAVRRIEVGTMAGKPNLMLCAPDPGSQVITDLNRGFDLLMKSRSTGVIDAEAGVDFDASDYYEADVTDQLPYGDFAPGRYAWLLADIKPLAEPIRARGRQGLWNWQEAA